MTSTQQFRHRRQYGCRRQHDSCQKPGAALGPLLFSYQGPSQKRLHEMLQKRQRRKQLRQQSKVQRSLTLWSERATDYVDELLKKNRKPIQKSTTSSFKSTIPILSSVADLKLPPPFRAQAAAGKANAPSTPALSRRVELFSADRRNNESRKMRTSRLDVGKLLTDISKVADVDTQLQPRRMLEQGASKDLKSKDSKESDGRRGSFEELKTAILNDLDNGYESLQFVLQVAPKFMSSMVNSALQQVACDYLWSKTIIEKIFRIWPLAAGSNNDKRLFRDVLIQLYKYITRSLITWLTQYSPSIPEDSPFLQELSKVIELLLKSVQCIAHHGSLSRTNKRLSFRGLFSSRPITTDRPELSADSLKVKKKFSAKTQKSLESAFVDQMKCLRRDIGQRKNSIKCARWLTLAVPREVQQEPMLLRSDSIASTAPLTSTFEPRKRRT